MLCPECECRVAPSEVMDGYETLQYDCPECLTSWRADVSHLSVRGLLAQRSAVVPVVVQDGSTQTWLVTDESSGVQSEVPGWRLAVRAVCSMIEERMSLPSPGTVSDGLGYELTASADPWHEATQGAPRMSMHVLIKLYAGVGVLPGEFAGAPDDAPVRPAGE